MHLPCTHPPPNSVTITPTPTLTAATASHNQSTTSCHNPYSVTPTHKQKLFPPSQYQRYLHTLSSPLETDHHQPSPHHKTTRRITPLSAHIHSNITHTHTYLSTTIPLNTHTHTQPNLHPQPHHQHRHLQSSNTHTYNPKHKHNQNHTHILPR